MSEFERVDLSIIIINFNTGSLVCDCLESLSCGVRRYSYRVLVVDNGSSDDSVALVRERFPEVTVIENGCNLGFAAANNIALKQANSEYYLLLNSDTVMCEGAIDRVLDFMAQQEDCGFASPQLLNRDGSLQNTAANFPTLLTELTNKSLLRLLFPSRYYKKKLVAEAPLAVESLVGAALCVKEKMTKDLGFYDAGYFFFLEETDWCRRGLEQGWRSYLVPDAVIYHLQGQTAKKVPFAVRIEYWRSRYHYFKCCFSWWVMVVLMCGLLVKNTINLLLNLLAAPFSVKSRHKFKLALHIFKWHILGLPATMGLSQQKNLAKGK